MLALKNALGTSREHTWKATRRQKSSADKAEHLRLSLFPGVNRISRPELLLLMGVEFDRERGDLRVL